MRELNCMQIFSTHMKNKKTLITRFHSGTTEVGVVNMPDQRNDSKRPEGAAQMHAW